MIISNIHKTYKNNVLYSNLSFEFHPGIHIIRGANGAGKSTLLRIIGGLEYFSKGDAIIEPELTLRKTPSRYRMFVNFSDAEPLFPLRMSGEEIAAHFLSTKRGSNTRFATQAEEIGLAKYLSQEISTYSSGMLKKLSILLAFVGNPKVILLDEPRITLDENALTVLDGWISHKAENGVTFIVSNHGVFPALAKQFHNYELIPGISPDGGALVAKERG